MNSVKINSPAVPYWGAVPGGLSVGKEISIKGVFPSITDKSIFTSFNLGENGKDDVALHMSIRFNHRQVILNSKSNGTWRKEEKVGPFPFELGGQFWIRIVVQLDAYYITVNGQQCWKFAHRMPFPKVNVLSIEGFLNIFLIEFGAQYNMPGVYPLPGINPGGCIPPIVDPGFSPGTCGPYPMRPGIIPYQPGTCLPPTMELEPVFNPPTPFNYPISGGIHPGMMIYISGEPTGNFHRFTINLQCGSAEYPPPDVAFHFDARGFNATVVRNTRRNDTWEQEETVAPQFPFHVSTPIDMIILVQNDKYMVAINGQHFIEFVHRMTRFSFINALKIEGDLKISSVRFART